MQWAENSVQQQPLGLFREQGVAGEVDSPPPPPPPMSDLMNEADAFILKQQETAGQWSPPAPRLVNPPVPSLILFDFFLSLHLLRSASQ
jgi:hypothetical protein